MQAAPKGKVKRSRLPAFSLIADGCRRLWYAASNDLTRQRAYLSCLLDTTRLKENGASCISHCQSSKYYQGLFAGKITGEVSGPARAAAVAVLEVDMEIVHNHDEGPVAEIAPVAHDEADENGEVGDAGIASEEELDSSERATSQDCDSDDCIFSDDDSDDDPGARVLKSFHLSNYVFNLVPYNVSGSPIASIGFVLPTHRTICALILVFRARHGCATCMLSALTK